MELGAAHVGEDDRLPTAVQVGVPPLLQREDDGPQLGPGFGQVILVAARTLRVRAALEDAHPLEPPQARREDITRAADPLQELGEARASVSDLPDHEQRVPITDEGEGIGDGAHPSAGRFLAHALNVVPVGLDVKPTRIRVRPRTTEAPLSQGPRGLGRPVCRALSSPTPWSASIAGAGFEPATFGL